MSDLLVMFGSKDEKEEIEELVSNFLILPKEDKEILRLYAYAFKVRNELENSKL